MKAIVAGLTTVLLVGCGVMVNEQLADQKVLPTTNPCSDGIARVCEELWFTNATRMPFVVKGILGFPALGVSGREGANPTSIYWPSHSLADCYRVKPGQYLRRQCELRDDAMFSLSVVILPIGSTDELVLSTRLVSPSRVMILRVVELNGEYQLDISIPSSAELPVASTPEPVGMEV